VKFDSTATHREMDLFFSRQENSRNMGFYIIGRRCQTG
jgi:hypothetical protein